MSTHKASTQEISLQGPETYVVLRKADYIQLSEEILPKDAKLTDFLDISEVLSIPQFIKLFRECKGVTLKTVGLDLKVDKQYLQKIESGIKPLTKNMELRLIGYWGIKFRNGLIFLKQNQKLVK